MGTFYTSCQLENHIRRDKKITIRKLLVDTGSEYTWISENSLHKIGVTSEKKDITFIMANGRKITRTVGFAIIRIEEFFTIDEVVFGQEGDMQLLGARTLEGLNLTVDSRQKKLVAAGPLPVAQVLMKIQKRYESTIKRSILFRVVINRYILSLNEKDNALDLLYGTHYPRFSVQISGRYFLEWTQIFLTITFKIVL
ncbi:MAG: retroviral-like aspartic protease family protein [Candidatus Cloacimonetes bacterium]|nr:retroviral-like aspartic protease family protein [Candidatus Cloacimonadota bacterium]